MEYILCEVHKDSAYVAAMGACSNCGGPTASMSFQLCHGCSSGKNACAICSKKLDEE